jgi:nucleoside-diphosphate-sugar epimerase
MQQRNLQGPVIVTGANGFSGRACIRIFNNAGYDVLPIVRKAAGLPDEAVIDFEDAEASSRLLALPAPRAVVHLASNVDFSPNAPDVDFFASGILATAMLGRICHAAGAPIILASGVIAHGPVLEINSETPVAPASAYGRSKVLAEQIVRASGTRHTILRIAGIFGRQGPSHLALNRIIDAALDNGDVPKIFGAGKGKRNYVYVDDLAEIILECVKSGISGTHLVAGPKMLTIAEMMTAVCTTFLPGKQPLTQTGDEANDVIVQHSQALPAGRSFEQCLIDIMDREPERR